MDKTDEIIKLKELLDKNIITPDDFEKLKKEIFDNQTVTSNKVILTDDEKLCPNCNKIIFISSEKCGFCDTYLSNVDTKNKEKACPQCGSAIPIESKECGICKSNLLQFETKSTLTETPDKPSKDYSFLKYVIFIAIAFCFILYNSNFFKTEKPNETLIDSTEVVSKKEDTINQETNKDSLANIVDTSSKDDYSNDKELVVGTDYQGGKIAYIFQSFDDGYIEGEIHGLIVADVSLFSKWGCPKKKIGSLSSLMGSGNSNTIKIISACGKESAAYVCSELNSGGYSDWLLPSKDELTEVYANINELGGYPSGSYGVWSSSELDENDSYVMSFDGKGRWITLPKSYGFYIKAIRYF